MMKNNYIHTHIHENIILHMYTHIYTHTHLKKIYLYMYWRWALCGRVTWGGMEHSIAKFKKNEKGEGNDYLHIYVCKNAFIQRKIKYCR